MDNKWQPIETAPTDGTEILVYGGQFGAMGVAAHIESVFDGSMIGTTKMWRSPYGDHVFSHVTHWMPLPEPPHHRKRTRKQVDAMVEMVRNVWTQGKE